MIFVLLGAISNIAPASADSGWGIIQEAREKYNYCSTASDCATVVAGFCNAYEVLVNKREVEKVQAIFVNFGKSGLQEGLCDAVTIGPTETVCKNNKCTSVFKRVTATGKSLDFIRSNKLLIGVILFPILLIGLVIFCRKKLFKPTPPA